MQYELNPILMEGKVVEVNDTAVKVDIQGRLGVITVPKRWVLTDFPLQLGLKVEFYFSYLQVTEPKQVPHGA
ncbi:CBO2463/CBO2479 domain-containing protein [Caproiciproducens sp. R1]|uniref:CBO2463/CBO2479 domain-containing protein n=1 Tax=Caproiciproducens sp. R1 TaxID=3435000 RepID=UPI0040342A79